MVESGIHFGESGGLLKGSRRKSSLTQSRKGQGRRLLLKLFRGMGKGPLLFQDFESEDPRSVAVAESDVVGVVTYRLHRFDT
jgi:hypothetical protein